MMFTGKINRFTDFLYKVLFSAYNFNTVNQEYFGYDKYF